MRGFLLGESEACVGAEAADLPFIVWVGTFRFDA
jgi:hypothetical protein